MSIGTSPTQLDQTLVAIAHPTRREILRQLANGEARVTEIAAEFPIALNSVSKHIRVLEDAGLLERRIVGRDHFLRFRPEPLDEAQEWIAAQQAFWTTRLQALDDLLAREETAQSDDQETGASS